MTEWPSRIQEFVNGIPASVAVVGHDNAGALIVSACNEIFFEMTGGWPAGARCFPMPFDTLVPSYARREFRDRIQECFNTGIAASGETEVGQVLKRPDQALYKANQSARNRVERA